MTSLGSRGFHTSQKVELHSTAPIGIMIMGFREAMAVLT
jgi:hypothetical protein